jgi:hypothetical protein
MVVVAVNEGTDAEVVEATAVPVVVTVLATAATVLTAAAVVVGGVEVVLETVDEVAVEAVVEIPDLTCFSTFCIISDTSDTAADTTVDFKTMFLATEILGWDKSCCFISFGGTLFFFSPSSPPCFILALIILVSLI